MPLIKSLAMRAIVPWLAIAVSASNCFADESAAPMVHTKSLWDVLVAGGPLMLPIAGCSFILLLVVFERTVALRRSRIVPRMFAERFLLQISEGALDKEEALDRCEENGSQVATVFAAAVRKWGKPAVEVEQAVIDEGERASNYMRRYLRVINGVSTVCPLFGLLGTVWGIMQSFEVIAAGSAMGKAELLAGGIGTALVSTAGGLTVAIPALVLYLYFAGRVDSLVMEIDRCGQELVNLISGEGLEERRSRPRSTKKKVA